MTSCTKTAFVHCAVFFTRHLKIPLSAFLVVVIAVFLSDPSKKPYNKFSITLHKGFVIFCNIAQTVPVLVLMLLVHD